jgi:hypothetical protein
VAALMRANVTAGPTLEVLSRGMVFLRIAWVHTRGEPEHRPSRV